MGGGGRGTEFSSERQRGKRKRSTIFIEKTREGRRQSGDHWNCLKGNIGENI